MAERPFLERNTRVWMGGSLRAWWRLLRAHGFRFSPSRAHLAAITTLCAPLNSMLGALGDLRVARARSTRPGFVPVFILGHWRSGTTLLHELLSRDRGTASPTTWECFAPHLSLWLNESGARRLPLRIPASRPMDNVTIDWESPQEDEFALCGMGCDSAYGWIAFPRSFEGHPERFAQVLSDTPVAADLERFLERLNYRRRSGRCPSQPPRFEHVVLKSPTHTFRLDELRRAFPEARFVHLRRDPELVFSSTRRLWRRLCDHQGLQTPRFDGDRESAALDEVILHTAAAMGRKLRADLERWRDEDRADHARRYTELSYDEIDPTREEASIEAVVERVLELYRGWELSPGPDLAARLTAHLQGLRRYVKNRHQELAEDELARVHAAWAELSGSKGA